METGIFPGMTRREYSKIDAINISTLIEGRKTMAHLKYAMDHRQEETDAMRIGTALHCAVLEPSEFEKRTAVFEGRRYGKEWDKFKDENQYNTILKSDQHESVIAMRDALNKFPPMRKLLDSKGTGEMGAVWRDEETGLYCKGMIDRVCEWNGYAALLDVKTCVDADKESFAKIIGNYAYHARAAWYLDGLAAIKPANRRFFFILVEKSAPHLCNWFDAHDDNDALIEEGRKLYKRILREYATALKTGVWNGYPLSDSPEQISLCKWDYE